MSLWQTDVVFIWYKFIYTYMHQFFLSLKWTKNQSIINITQRWKTASETKYFQIVTLYLFHETNGWSSFTMLTHWARKAQHDQTLVSDDMYIICIHCMSYSKTLTLLKYPPCNLMCPFKAWIFLNFLSQMLQTTGFVSSL